MPDGCGVEKGCVSGVVETGGEDGDGSCCESECESGCARGRSVAAEHSRSCTEMPERRDDTLAYMAEERDSGQIE